MTEEEFKLKSKAGTVYLENGHQASIVLKITETYWTELYNGSLYTWKFNSGAHQRIIKTLVLLLE